MMLVGRIFKKKGTSNKCVLLSIVDNNTGVFKMVGDKKDYTILFEDVEEEGMFECE